MRRRVLFNVVLGTVGVGLKLIDRFVSLPLDGPWPVDATWGEVNGPFASKIQAKHFDHHLRQFNA